MTLEQRAVRLLVLICSVIVHHFRPEGRVVYEAADIVLDQTNIATRARASLLRRVVHAVLEDRKSRLLVKLCHPTHHTSFRTPTTRGGSNIFSGLAPKRNNSRRPYSSAMRSASCRTVTASPEQMLTAPCSRPNATSAIIRAASFTSMKSRT